LWNARPASARTVGKLAAAHFFDFSRLAISRQAFDTKAFELRQAFIAEVSEHLTSEAA
jgi:hypothetical protein